MRADRKGYDPARILLSVSNTVSTSLSLKEVSRVVLRESINALGTDHSSLFLIDESRRHLMLEEVMGFKRDEIENIKVLGSWEAINTQLVKRKKPLMVNDVHRNLLFKDKKLPFSKERLPVSSFLAAPLIKDREVIGALIVSNKKRSMRVFAKEDMHLLRTLSNHVAIALLNARLYEDMRELFISTVKSLVRAIDAKDPYTSGHSERVMRYSTAIGRVMGLDEARLENLGLSSLLHDVGKIGIREKILAKPGKLSSLEKRQMRLHTSIGVRIVDTIKNAGKIIRGIKEHHERFDGKGYPAGLKGGAISPEARIVAVADTFDALTTNRPYRKAHTKDRAFLNIRRGSSRQFDPAVVRAFVSSYKKDPRTWSP